MKRYYDTPLEMLKDKKYRVFLFFIAGIIGGTLYAITIREDPVFFFAIKHYTSLEKLEVDHFELMKYAFFDYGRKGILIWLSGLFSITFPLGVLIFFMIAFAYGFTIACFILLYGAKGLLIAFFSCGLQSILFVLTCFYILYHACDYRTKHHEKRLEKYIKKLGWVGVGLVLIAGADGIVQPLFQKIIHFLI